MRAYLFIGLSLIALATAEVLDIPANGKSVNMIPKVVQGVTEYLYELKAAEGSKMILTCAFKTFSCSNAKITVDTGSEVTQHCPEDGIYVFKSSNKNKMFVTIENMINTVGAYCQVKSTKPYLDMPENEVDSSEHGLPHNSQKAPTCRCGWTNKPRRRIVGGKEAGVNEYPFIGLIVQAQTLQPFCGGSIITPYHVLTAAHCTDPYKDRLLGVIIGEHDVRTKLETSATKMHIVSKIYQHNGYSKSTKKDDIAILELSSMITFSDKVGPVCMPSSQKNLVDQYIKVMGWGWTKDRTEGGVASPVLQKVNLRVIDADVCKILYGLKDSLTQMCTYNNKKDSCQGDSGGPLVSLNPETNMYEQVALVSYGRKCGSTDPAINTDVAAFIPWIKEQLASSQHEVSLCF